MEDAANPENKKNKKIIDRQIVRICLPRSANNDQLGAFYEADVTGEGNSNQNYDPYADIVLVPPDETWQGGIMQLYRSASLACQEILRRYSRNAPGGVVPRLVEDRSYDESGVDGVGLWSTEDKNNGSSAVGVSCFVQPSQETIDGIESYVSKEEESSRLVVLLNPQWRIVDDALDVASRNTNNPFGKLASFLGGKGGSLKRLEDDMGFENVYVLEGYVCRGGNVRLMKRFDTDWFVFAENDDGNDYIPVGSLPNRPSYQDVDKMLEDKGISLKYARDIGLAPKL